MDAEEFVVYILYSVKGKITYVGYSSCSIERFHWHNYKSTKGFTIRYRPWTMIHVEFYNTKAEALAREKYLKMGIGRSWIKNTLIKDL